jgi:hypothetical protein
VKRARTVTYALLLHLSLVCLGAACGPATSAVPVAAPAVESASPPSPPPSVAIAPSAEEKRAAAALARVPAIAEAVATIRQLPLKHAVPAVVQSQDDFRVYLDKEVQKEMPIEKTAQSVRALVRLGFLKKAIDLGKTVEDAMISQAGAYYDPETKKFYLVLIPEDAAMLDIMSAHELTHALDDQYFDLGAYTDDPKHELTNDVQQARRIVAEGEATLVMVAYQAKVAAKQDIFDPKNLRMEQAMVAAFAALDSEQLAKAAADNPELLSQMGPSMKASIDAMSSIPPFILDPLFGAYTKGAAAVAAVRDAGGWDAVGALYTDPPESTEQLLHPREKLIAHRDHPVSLSLPPLSDPAFHRALAGLTPIDHDVLGEMTMEVYFKNWGDPHPADEVLGWGGDAYTVYARGDALIGCWLTSWDTMKDAQRFAKAYAATLPTRFPGEHAWVGTGGARGVTHADGSVTALVSGGPGGRDVYIVDGAPSRDADAFLDWMHHRLIAGRTGP